MIKKNPLGCIGRLLLWGIMTGLVVIIASQVFPRFKTPDSFFGWLFDSDIPGVLEEYEIDPTDIAAPLPEWEHLGAEDFFSTGLNDLIPGIWDMFLGTEITSNPVDTASPDMDQDYLNPALSHVPFAQCIPNNPVEEVTLLYPIDGDTFQVQFEDGSEGRIRLISIDTPETKKPNTPVEFFGPEASAFTKNIIQNAQAIWLIKDVSEFDRYNRYLRYVIVDGTFLNYQLVSEGYANVMTLPPDVACADLILEGERNAREAGAGLWGSP